LATGEARHFGIGRGEVSESEDGCLANHLEGRADLDDVRPASCRQFTPEESLLGPTP
jgi:hypothetical protein